MRLFEQLPEHPVLTVTTAMGLLACTRPAASKALGVLNEAGFMMPLDKKGKGAMLGFEPSLAILREGTDGAA